MIKKRYRTHLNYGMKRMVKLNSNIIKKSKLNQKLETNSKFKRDNNSGINSTDNNLKKTIPNTKNNSTINTKTNTESYFKNVFKNNHHLFKRKSSKISISKRNLSNKNLSSNGAILLSLIVIFVLLAGVYLIDWSGITGLATFADSNQTHFNLGTYSNTFFNTTNNSVMLNTSLGLTGSFTSQVFNASASATWNNISYKTSAWGELPNALNTTETAWASRNFDMTGIYGLYHLNNDSAYGENASAVNDFSPNNRDGTVTAALFNLSNQKLGAGSYYFDGDGDYISIGEDNSFAGKNLTILAWINMKTLQTDIARWIVSRHQNSVEKNFELGIETSGKVIFGTYSTCSGALDTVASLSAISTGKWYMVGATIEHNLAKSLYVNGTFQDSNGVSPVIQDCAATQPTAIGNRLRNTALGFTGNIDEVAIFQRVLSSAEIEEYYKRTATKYNLTVRSCDDSACSGESFTNINDTSPQQLATGYSISDNQYFQYNLSFESDDVKYTPNLYNFTIDYTVATVDSTKPLVNTTIPTENSVFNITNTIEIAVNATDETAINTVYANISCPNGTLKQLTLNNGTEFDNKYNTSFTLTYTTGIYNITYFANDSSNNINSSTTTNFTVKTSCATLSSAGIVTLDQNIETTGNCFDITSNDVNLIGTSYTITGDLSGSDYGVRANGYNNITIINATIINFDSSLDFSNVDNQNLTIFNSLFTNASTSAISLGGIKINITQNTLEKAGSTELSVATSASSISLYHNIITSNNTSGQLVRFTEKNGNHSLLYNNTLIGGTGGFFLNAFQENVTILSNTIENQTNAQGISVINGSRIKVQSNNFARHNLASFIFNNVSLGEISNNIIINNTFGKEAVVVNNSNGTIFRDNQLNNSGIATGVRFAYYVSYSSISNTTTNFNNAVFILYGDGGQSSTLILADNTLLTDGVFNVTVNHDLWTSANCQNVVGPGSSNCTFITPNYSFGSCGAVDGAFGAGSCSDYKANVFLSQGAGNSFTVNESKFTSTFNLSAGATYPPYITANDSVSNGVLFIDSCNGVISNNTFYNATLGYNAVKSGCTNNVTYENTYGKIEWISTSFTQNLSLNAEINVAKSIGIHLGNNSAAVNTSAFNPTTSNINTSANITLYTLNNWSSINGIKWLQNYSTDSSKIRSEGTNCTNCYIQSFSAGTLIFNVSSFSSYAGDFVSAAVNNLPSAPSLISPANYSTTTSRTPTFIWNNSVDADSDTLTYNLVVDDNFAFNNPEVNVTGIAQGTTNSSYNITEVLNVDTYYYWKVAANDSTGYGNWSNYSNFTVQSYLLISLTTNAVGFGLMSQDERNDTSDGAPLPFTAENAGNIVANVSINASAYFTSVSFPSSYYQFKIRANESGAFDTSQSNLSYINMSDTSNKAQVANLSWQDAYDDFLVDINITVPTDELSGAKSSTVTFTIEG